MSCGGLSIARILFMTSEQYTCEKLSEDGTIVEEKRASSEESGDPGNTLVLASGGGHECCTDHLSQASFADSNLLGITYSQRAYERLDAWEREGEHPRNTTVIDIGVSTRSASADSVGSIDNPADSFTIWTLDDETNMARLGKLAVEELSEWDHDGRRTTVCFYSVTDLLEHVDQETAFQFLHVLTSRFDSKDIDAHYHMDPSAHDEKTIRIFSEVFDAVVHA